MAKRPSRSSVRVADRRYRKAKTEPIRDLETSGEDDPQTAEDKFMTIARERFKAAQEAEKDQCEREIQDLKFYAGEQWPEDVKTIRAGQNASNGLPPTPARPTLTINKTREPIRQILNQERQADLGIELVPADDFEGLIGPIDDTEIELREGLVRRIQRTSEAQDARTWAYMRSTIAGRGYYLITTRYVDLPLSVPQPGVAAFDQEIRIERIYNQNAVTLGPHEMPDGSDALDGFIGTLMPMEEYLAQFETIGEKNNPLRAYDNADDFQGLYDDYPDWFELDGERRMCRVVDYYYTDFETRDLVEVQDIQNPLSTIAKWAEDLQDGEKVLARRRVTEKTIKVAKLDGTQILEQTDLPWHCLPIVKVIGEELQPYDKERRAEGMVRQTRDSQQGFNYMVSKWVEVIGLTPIPPLILDPESIETFEPWYQAANTRTLPYLPQRSRDDQGREFREAHRPSVDPPIAAIASSVQMFDEAIKATTGVPDASLGNVDPSVRSGRAIKSLQAASQHGTSNYLDNLVRSIRHEARLINEGLYTTYNRPGRLTSIVNGEGQTETLLLGTPFVRENGRPVPAPPQAPMMPGQPQPTQSPQAPIEYKLTKDARFNVAVKVTRQFDTRREQEQEILGNLLSHAPEQMAVFGDLWFESQDGPGHKEMAERARVMLAPPVQKMLSEKAKGQRIDPGIQAQIAERDQMIQQLSQHLEQASKMLQTDAIKEKAATDREAMKQDAMMEKTRADNETKIAVAALTSEVKRLSLFLEERSRLGLQQHEVSMNAADRSADEAALRQAEAHEIALNAADAEDRASMADRSAVNPNGDGL